MTPQPESLPALRIKSLPMSVVALVLALLAGILLLVAGPGYRLGLWPFRTGFALMTYSAWIGLGAALCALVPLIVSVMERRWKMAAMPAVVLILGVVSCVVPYFWKRTAQQLPRIHDISTDTVNPPRFVAMAPLRAHAVNPLEYGGPEIARKQQLGYPDITSLSLAIPFDQAFGRALDTAQRMGWNVVAAVPAQGRIEASDTTFWFGFTDDIVIRVMPSGSGARLDIRSVSRVGQSDAGTNARRIRSYLDALRG